MIFWNTNVGEKRPLPVCSPLNVDANCLDLIPNNPYRLRAAGRVLFLSHEARLKKNKFWSTATTWCQTHVYDVYTQNPCIWHTEHAANLVIIRAEG